MEKKTVMYVMIIIVSLASFLVLISVILNWIDLSYFVKLVCPLIVKPFVALTSLWGVQPLNPASTICSGIA